MFEIFLKWITENYIEIIATIFGLFYIFFSIKQNVWLWPFGLINVALYIYVYYHF